MPTAHAIAHDFDPEPAHPDIDERVYLRMDWRRFLRFLAVRGDDTGTRITYLDGVLEIMSPSTTHEKNKTKLARIVEVYTESLGIDLEGYGSWTLKDGRKKGGAEPDECYVRVAPGTALGDDPRRPDFAVEVVHTSGGLDKLEVYRRLGMREVWNYERGVLSIFVLDGGQYLEVSVSSVLPELDRSLIERCMREDSQMLAIRALRAAIGEAAGG